MDAEHKDQESQPGSQPGSQADFVGAAKFYLARGFSPIPISRSSKAPRLRKGYLETYSKRRPTEEELEEWFSNKDDDLGIGLILPPGVIVIDIDGKDLWRLVSSKAPEEKAGETWVHETPRGYRIFLRATEEAEVKQAKAVFPGEHRGIEIKTGGKGFVVAPPTPGYRALNTPLQPLQVLNMEQVGVLVHHVEIYGEYAKVIDAFSRIWNEGVRHELTGPLAGTLRKKGVTKEDCEIIIDGICSLAGDEEKNDRLRYIRDTYSKSLKEISGLATLLEVVKGVIEPSEMEEVARALAPKSAREAPLEAEQKIEEELASLTPEEIEEATHELSIDELTRILGLTIKHDDTNKVIQFIAMLLTYTEDSQINISNRGPSGSGKTYIPLELASLYFPSCDTIAIGYSSPTAFFHERGEWNEAEKAFEINLERKILIFMDQPHDQLLQRLRPLLSHDRKRLRVKITDKRDKKGLRTKNVDLIGFPSVFFCTGSMSRIDEQEATRHIILSPETSVEKIREAMFLKALRKGNPLKYEEMLKSNRERELLRRRVLLIRRERVKHILFEDTDAVTEKFIQKYGGLKPRHTRDLERVMSIAQGLALLNLWHRKRDKDGNIYVNQEDVENAFKLYEELARSQELGIPPYLLRLYDEVFKPLFDKVGDTGVSRREIIANHLEVYGRPLPDWQLRREILPALEAAGLVYQEPDPLDKRRMLIHGSTPYSSSLFSSPQGKEKNEDLEKTPPKPVSQWVFPSPEPEKEQQGLLERNREQDPGVGPRDGSGDQDNLGEGVENRVKRFLAENPRRKVVYVCKNCLSMLKDSKLTWGFSETWVKGCELCGANETVFEARLRVERF